jgi:hypothetical protein
MLERAAASTVYPELDSIRYIEAPNESANLIIYKGKLIAFILSLGCDTTSAGVQKIFL